MGDDVVITEDVVHEFCVELDGPRWDLPLDESLVLVGLTLHPTTKFFPTINGSARLMLDELILLLVNQTALGPGLSVVFQAAVGPLERLSVDFRSIVAPIEEHATLSGAVTLRRRVS